MLQEIPGTTFSAFWRLQFLSFRVPDLHLDLVEFLVREKALKEILPLMEKDERNLKDRRPKNTLRRPSPAPLFHFEQTKRT